MSKNVEATPARWRSISPDIRDIPLNDQYQQYNRDVAQAVGSVLTRISTVFLRAGSGMLAAELGLKR
jgi:cell fate (sporulation/competence/biofilm development) regulator YmcA (YheA/YmcA/DUF963 family)